MPKESNSLTKTVRRLIQEGAKKYNVPTYNLSSAQFWSVASGKIKEWDVRKIGGFTALRDAEFPAPEQAHSVIPRKTKKIKFVQQKLVNFTVHKTNLKEVFAAANLKDSEILRVVVQPDTHVPEHDESAVNAFCKFLEFYKPHGLINLGDFLEMDSVSHWPANTLKPRRLVPEILKAKEVLTQIEKAAGPQCVFKRFIKGNHEDFLDQYLVARIPEMADSIDDLGVGLRAQDLLSLKDFGYRVIPLNEILQVGDLYFIHGYYTCTHHAKKHLDVFGVNLVYGHEHDCQTYSGVSVRGVHEASSSGCLRKLNADFLKGKPTNWQHAFTIVEFRLDGSFTKYTPHIIDGKFTFNGKVFDGNT